MDDIVIWGLVVVSVAAGLVVAVASFKGRKGQQGSSGPDSGDVGGGGVSLWSGKGEDGGGSGWSLGDWIGGGGSDGGGDGGGGGGDGGGGGGGD